MPRFRRTTLLIALTTALVALTASPASAAPVFASGFEDPQISDGFKQYAAGEQLGAWTVASGSVDIVTYWEHAEGQQSLDLNGSAEGAVSRTVPAQLLTTYKVTYAVAGNPEGGPTVKSGKVSINGQQVDAFSFSIAGKSIYNMGWVYRSFYFTNLLSASSVLQFSSTSPSIWGPALDDVKVESCLLIFCPASASTVNRIQS
ncbi:choice-of-anchor C family protein [Kribbella sp. NPDC056861]|uniref:choice-of-anchor C family protein n=1 Tax=Kribbella sp. NPDC056861 TaxID=3154857 RepID=UPI00341E7BBD